MNIFCNAVALYWIHKQYDNICYCMLNKWVFFCNADALCRIHKQYENIYYCMLNKWIFFSMPLRCIGYTNGMIIYAIACWTSEYFSAMLMHCIGYTNILCLINMLICYSFHKSCIGMNKPLVKNYNDDDDDDGCRENL